ncbi:MAG TPA: septal ring lytic transglycosylase RlpA family protein [Ramlibacter sp.]|nr:septal ring lytic transglycosylase RlpA family protein [Ramlibacter sp.]
MMQSRIAATIAFIAVSLCCALFDADATAAQTDPGGHVKGATPTSKSKKLDRSGRKQVGKASFYSHRFAGRKMADGTPMKPHADNAASKTLPLGTRAKVTNLETGQSTAVTIQDRGPYVRGRIVDLSPRTAQEIGISRKDGVARVEVAPITVPQHDGQLKPGDGAK